MKYKEDWPEAKERLKLFWRGEPTERVPGGSVTQEIVQDDKIPTPYPCMAHGLEKS